MQFCLVQNSLTGNKAAIDVVHPLLPALKTTRIIEQSALPGQRFCPNRCTAVPVPPGDSGANISGLASATDRHQASGYNQQAADPERQPFAATSLYRDGCIPDPDAVRLLMRHRYNKCEHPQHEYQQTSPEKHPHLTLPLRSSDIDILLS
jgi:hypothetical protein